MSKVRSISVYLWVACFSLIGSTGAFAHHSIAKGFDHSEIIEIVGTVVEYNLENPHTTIIVDVQSGDGAYQAWTVHTSSLLRLVRIWGWDEDSLIPGDEVRVTGFAARDFVRAIYVHSIEIVDGEVLIDAFIP